MINIINSLLFLFEYTLIFNQRMFYSVCLYWGTTVPRKNGIKFWSNLPLDLHFERKIFSCYVAKL